MKRNTGWRGKDGIGEPLFDGVACSVGVAGEPRRGTTGRCRQHFLRGRPRAAAPMPPSALGLVSEWRNQSRDLTMWSELTARVAEEARRDMEELKSSYRTVKKRRACSAGTPPAELWTMLLHASRNLSPAGLGIGYQRRKIEPVRSLSVLERLLCRVRSSGAAPLAWHHSSGAPLHNSNKAGPKGKRVVHVLPSMGRQFFKVLLRTKRDSWSPPAPADWLHGYISERRRESAVLIRQVTIWRLERLGLRSLTAFHDLTNAFGSVKWEAWIELRRRCWARITFWNSRDTGWRPRLFQAVMGTFRSKLVKVD